MTTENKIGNDRSRLINIIAGSFIIMFPLGIFAELLVRNRLISFKNPALTYESIKQSLVLFDSGILAFMSIIILDVVLAIAFYGLLFSVNKTAALLTASFRLLYVAIKGFAIVGLFLARDIYSRSDQMNLDNVEASAMQAMQFLKMHHYGFGVGLIFFGLHLLLLAFLFFKTQQVPKWIAGLLMTAGAGYVANSIVSLFVINEHMLETIIIAVFIIPMSFAEILLGLSLWVRHKTPALDLARPTFIVF